MTCPYLDRRTEAFDTARPYCEVAGRFVQPMRADICSNRYGLDHAVHCEIYRDHEEGGRVNRDEGKRANRDEGDDSEGGDAG